MEFHANQFERIATRLWLRTAKPPRYWHNRFYSLSQSLHIESETIELSWRGYQKIAGKSLLCLPNPRTSVVRIVGSGPSIGSLAKPERLFDATTVLVNGASILAKDLREFDFYFVADPDFLTHNPEAFQLGIAKAKYVILNLQTAFALMKSGLSNSVKGDIYLRDELLYPFKRNRRDFGELVLAKVLHRDSTNRIGFSMKPHLGTCTCGTVIYQAIQVFAAKRTKRIELYGMDLSQGRFYAESNPAPTSLDRVFENKLIPGFRLANRVCSEIGCELVNCSLQSRLPSDIVAKEDPNLALGKLDA